MNVKHLGLYTIIGLNVFLFAEYLYDNNNAKNVVFIFWIASILSGIQNILMMLFTTTGFTLNQERKIHTGWFTNIFFAGFFTIHFGIFILALGAFAVFSDKIPGDLFHARWVYPAFLLLLVSAIIELPGKLIGVRQQNVSLIKLMFVPYIRLFPFFAIMTGSTVFKPTLIFVIFLMLKLIVDLVYYRFMNIRPVEN